MRLPMQLKTLTVLAVGAMLGYLTASNGPPTSARAEITRPAAGIPTEQANKVPAPRVPCCDPLLDRKSALTEPVEVADGRALVAAHNLAVTATAQATGKKPNILIIWGDDVGPTNLSIYSRGFMGYRTPNIDRIGKEGAVFTDH